MEFSSKPGRMVTALWAMLLSIVVSAQEMMPASNNSINEISSGVAKGAQSNSILMSILFSTGGILVLIFILLAVTGVLRARRHPERYGPRRGELGLPKQTRVKGLARAMLETLPVVKFGENDDRYADKATHRNIELVDAAETERTQSSSSHHDDHPTVSVPAAGGVPAIGIDIEARTHGLECVICTEDFVQSEDIRVLPCDHKFHPTCIDPWLVNMSGTCPLW